MRHEIPEPWNGFLREIDEALDLEVQLHCHGGFVVAMCYGFERHTGDVDFLAVVPAKATSLLLSLAGRGSPLHDKYKIYLDHFGMVDPPDSYEKRLAEMFPGSFRKLRLFALDPYDLALTKLRRNLARDREDVRYLAEAVPLDLTILQTRYKAEVRPYLGDPRREDLTLQLCVEDIAERRGKG